MFKKDSLITGILVGIAVPIVAYALIMILFEQLDQMDGSAIISIRPRTHALLAIAGNLIPVQIAQRKRWNASLKGVIFSTIILCGFWLYKYSFLLYT